MINNNRPMGPSFGARVRMSNINPKTVRDAAEIGTKMGLASSGLQTTASATVGSSATHALGSAANTIGTAFSAKASGLNSSGIVPSVIGAATPHATPATIASSNAHPSLMGSFFTSIGDFIHSRGIKIKVNDPSR